MTIQEVLKTTPSSPSDNGKRDVQELIAKSGTRFRYIKPNGIVEIKAGKKSIRVLMADLRELSDTLVNEYKEQNR